MEKFHPLGLYIRYLAPILERMKRSRMIRSADQVVKRISTTLEYPSQMLNCLNNNNYDECCKIYNIVLFILVLIYNVSHY